MKMNVVPEPSERWTTLMADAGNVTPEFKLCIAASFHMVILPWNMSAITCPVSLRPFETP